MATVKSSLVRWCCFSPYVFQFYIANCLLYSFFYCLLVLAERQLLVLQGLEDLDLQEDQNAVFVCELSVEDVPGEWYKNGERIQPTSTIKIRQEGQHQSHEHVIYNLMIPSSTVGGQHVMQLMI